MLKMWYAILTSNEVKEGKLYQVKRLNKTLALWRYQNKLYAIDDCCRHRGASLSQGCLNNGIVQCPFHGFEFDGSGQIKLIPANGMNAKLADRYNTDSYPIKEHNGIIWMFNGNQASGDVLMQPGIEKYVASYSKNLWQTHYTRCIENQLDVVHLPFVHKKTIGRGHKTLVNGPGIKKGENTFRFYVFNEVDQGQTPIATKDLTNLEQYFNLDFYLPNFWVNNISDQFKVSAFFAPVDDHSTYVYVGSLHQVKIPIIKNIMSATSNIFNGRILREDQRVVENQLPKNSLETTSEKLIPGDLPISEYRKIMRSLLENND